MREKTIRALDAAIEDLKAKSEKIKNIEEFKDIVNDLRSLRALVEAILELDAEITVIKQLLLLPKDQIDPIKNFVNQMQREITVKITKQMLGQNMKAVIEFDLDNEEDYEDYKIYKRARRIFGLVGSFKQIAERKLGHELSDETKQVLDDIFQELLESIDWEKT